MYPPKDKLSRRTFLKGLQFAPGIFVSAEVRGRQRWPRLFRGPTEAAEFSFADLRVNPHYPARTPIDDLLLQVVPGRDNYKAEKYAFEIIAILGGWSKALKSSPPEFSTFAQFISPAVESSSLGSSTQVKVRSGFGIEVVRRRFGKQTVSGHGKLLDQLKQYCAGFARLDTVEFEITGIDITSTGEIAGSLQTLVAEVRYEFAGVTKDGGLEQRIGSWGTNWIEQRPAQWQLTKLEASEETASRARAAFFVDVTEQAMGNVDSYHSHLSRGTDYWRTVLDGACGIDVYGNNGIAAGDYDNDGWDDIYICQPAGLPNRLYRNRGDGSFEDVTAAAGVDVLDATSCALFADFENKGVQDLLIVCEGGPLLFLNQGNGKFELRRDAFKFAKPAQGTFTHAALADYDHDGRLDIYFCLYNYYLGLEQYHYPVPYFDARNGPANFLFHNEGNGRFQDRTQEAGLNTDNDRYSFACAWGDCNANGWPDLYVANDFGRSNLYRNNGDGTFSSAAAEAGVQEAGAGMSACWADFDGDGKLDIYVGNMWSPPGMRVSAQSIFHEGEPESIRALYRRHASGNSLYRNKGDGKFQNVTISAGVEMGRWAWSSEAWDFDHDGYPDLYIANGYISGTESPDLASFFWRQLVANSPQNSSPSPGYERGWNAINELIRSDGTWNGYERNVVYANHGDGTFSNVSGVTGLDFPDDARAFSLADLDHDGRLEVVLKNRNAPQLRLLRNVSNEIGNSVGFRLRGTKSNRDAIGAAVTVEASGRRQTKYLQAGSGFLSQHGKELFFGLGINSPSVEARVQWPSGEAQNFGPIPINHRIEIEEGSPHFIATPFTKPRWTEIKKPIATRTENLASSCETWLLQPLTAPDFSLADYSGKITRLHSLRGKFVLLNLFAEKSPACKQQISLLTAAHSELASAELEVLAMNVGEGEKNETKSSGSKPLPFPVLPATQETIGIYNIVFRYLFDRHRNLPLPLCFLIDKQGQIVKIYQETVHPDRVLADLKAVPAAPEDRMRAALPFPGKLYEGEFQRNDFTYGVAFFQRGYLDQAAESFKQVVAAKPKDAEAYYNLGTLYLRRNDPEQAQKYLQQTVKLRPNYPEAWNNLGMLAAQQGQTDEAIQNFSQSLALRPDYVTALVNLGNLYRRQKLLEEAGKLLHRALAIEPNNPEANYGVGMLQAQQGDVPGAEQYFQKAISLRPDYADAINNLGVLLVREQRYSEAEERFKKCMQAAPNYDQAYLNLARLYVMLDRKNNAREVLQALLRQQPDHKMAHQALEMLH
jgi:Flp pilus assembly protein TadD/thiol-disulfide isomerase/thioredoxin